MRTNETTQARSAAAQTLVDMVTHVGEAMALEARSRAIRNIFLPPLVLGSFTIVWWKLGGCEVASTMFKRG